MQEISGQPLDGPTRVMIIDDHLVVRSGVRMLLESLDSIAVVGEAADSSEAQDMIARLRDSDLGPQVVLMDVQMRERDEGFDATAKLMTRWPEIGILIFTSFDTEESVARAISVGARGYLLKDSSAEMIEHAIRGVRLGQVAFSWSAMQRLSQSALESRAPQVTLTAREEEIVQLVARDLTNREIATMLFVSEATVKTHVANLLTKLAVSTRGDAVIAAREFGILD